METDMWGMAEAIRASHLAVRSVRLLEEGETVGRLDFSPDIPHPMYSVSKTITMLTVGCLWAEGKLGLSQPMTDFFPRAKGSPFAHTTVEQLLTMSTGHTRCPLEAVGYRGDFLEAFFSAEKGEERFVYNNGGCYLLSRIVEDITGSDLRREAIRRLFDPLAIPPPRWDGDGEGHVLGFTGLYLTADQLAAVGQLLLQKGVLQGKPLLPGAFLEKAMTKRTETAHIDTPWATADSRAGYGYCMWMNSRPGSCRMDGLMGQYCVILPDTRRVAVYVSDELKNMLDILALTWKFF